MPLRLHLLLVLVLQLLVLMIAGKSNTRTHRGTSLWVEHGLDATRNVRECKVDGHHLVVPDHVVAWERARPALKDLQGAPCFGSGDRTVKYQSELRHT
jgi:hypothetical protein